MSGMTEERERRLAEIETKAAHARVKAHYPWPTPVEVLELAAEVRALQSALAAEQQGRAEAENLIRCVAEYVKTAARNSDSEHAASAHESVKAFLAKQDAAALGKSYADEIEREDRQRAVNAAWTAGHDSIREEYSRRIKAAEQARAAAEAKAGEMERAVAATRTALNVERMQRKSAESRAEAAGREAEDWKRAAHTTGRLRDEDRAEAAACKQEWMARAQSAESERDALARENAELADQLKRANAFGDSAVADSLATAAKVDASEQANRTERALWSRLYGVLTGQGADFQGCYSHADLERAVKRVEGMAEALREAYRYLWNVGCPATLMGTMERALALPTPADGMRFRCSCGASWNRPEVCPACGRRPMEHAGPADVAATKQPDPPPITFAYRNHRGEVATRHVRPVAFRFGTAPPWYTEPQWILEAFDVEKGAMRSFAWKGVIVATVARDVAPDAGQDGGERGGEGRT